jgi:hypothetical protein
MAAVYLETSFVSACVTERTDVGSVYRYQVSRQWWDAQAPLHDVFISAEVIAELSAPTYPQSSAALAWIGGIPLLDIDADAQGLAHVLVREKVMPGPARGDALHVAVCCVHAMDYMLTWNVRHLANMNKRRHLRRVCARCGYVGPEIITPDLLWEPGDGRERP